MCRRYCPFNVGIRFLRIFNYKAHPILFYLLKGFVMASKESKFQAKLIKDLEYLFPGCVVIKNDANYIQGFPDLLVLYKDKWAALECKRERKASHRPNQDYYVSRLNNMSYACFISPENREDVLNDLQQTFKS